MKTRSSDIQSILKESWLITKEKSYLNKFAIIAAFFNLLSGAIFVILRVQAFMPGQFPALDFISFANIFEFYRNYSGSLWVLFTITGLVILVYIFIPVITECAIIGSIAKEKEDHIELNFGKGLAIGFNSLLPLLEYEALTVFLNISRVITAAFLIWRFFGIESLRLLSIPIVIVFIVIFLISILLIYAKYNVVIHHGQVFKSIIKSITLVTFYISETFLLLLIIGLTIITTIINFLIVFAIPIGITALTGYLLTYISGSFINIFLGIIITIFTIIMIRYLAAIKLFITAVWTLTFIELSKRKLHKLVAEH